ncbi:MAG: GIY-YIG nuclease family protein [Rhodanobacter sp.]
MKHRPQTIQIFLPTGDPRGIRVAEITTRIVRVIEVPRSELAGFLAMPEANQVGVYFLVGDTDDAGLRQLYIGQSGDLVERLRNHQRNKDFWNRAFVVVSLTNSLTQTHALFLEWFAIDAARAAGRYSLENGNAGSRPYTPAPLEADCLEVHETAASLLATLGQPIFESLTTAFASGVDSQESPGSKFYCAGPGAKASGYYTNEGFVVLMGSLARANPVVSWREESEGRYRQLLKESVLAVEDGDSYRFTRDFLFSSPSMAAAMVLARHANGWREWRTEDGRTLDAMIRQAADVD